MTRRCYDAIIIGSGQAGTPLALALAKNGWKTALIERDHVGGTCINTGCTPTKTLIASARVAHLTRRADDFGVYCNPIGLDFSDMIDRKDAIVESFRKSQRQQIEQTENLDLIKGDAYFINEKAIEVRMDEHLVRQVEARTIFINTGTRPHIPLITGIESVPTLDEDDLMNLGTLPRHLVILGGGPVGLEFAQMFARFGSRVSVIEMHDRLLPDEDRDVADAMLEILCYEDIDIRLGSQIKRVDPTRDGDFLLQVASDGDQVQTMTGSHFLVAAGRRPNTDRLDVEKAGIKTDAEGFIMTNESLQTNMPHVYALGDVRGGPAFTHMAYDDFRIIRTNLLEDGHATIRNRPVPYVIFTDPELGRVGMTERDARQQGFDIKVGKMPMSHVARAREMGETQGLMKVVVDADTDLILGCAILGVRGGEVMSVLQTAMMGRVSCAAIRDGIFAHPTLTESLNTLFMTVDD